MIATLQTKVARFYEIMEEQSKKIIDLTSWIMDLSLAAQPTDL